MCASVVPALACSKTPENADGATDDAGRGASRPEGDAAPATSSTSTSMAPSSSVAPPSSSGCAPPLAHCDALACCSGSLCLDQGDGKRCVQTCRARLDCGSLCCLQDTATKQMLCAASDACPPLPCSDVGGSCSQPGPTCCAGLTCVSSSTPDYAGCHEPCQTASDCDTGCCVPYTGGKLGFCGAASLCRCAAMDATCGGTAHCCSGLQCTTFDSTGAFACRPSCTTAADCSTACCVPVTGTTTSACLPSSWCGAK